jgi:hypothetical protein
VREEVSQEIRELVETASLIVANLDEREIGDLALAGVSSGHLKDMGEILYDLGELISTHRDRFYYKGDGNSKGKLRRIK